MPQKKNPDVPELVRGKAGRVFGDLMALLTLMKGQPLAYNKDNQEDKEPLFDALDTLSDCLTAMLGMLPHLRVRADRMRAAAAQGFATATDLADYLVRKDVPFRDAHEIVGRCVADAIVKGVGLSDLTLHDLQRFCPAIDATVYDVLTLEGSVNARNHFGGTAPVQVRAAIVRGRARL
jgi:argininosuccinate lyase